MTTDVHDDLRHGDDDHRMRREPMNWQECR